MQSERVDLFSMPATFPLELSYIHMYNARHRAGVLPALSENPPERKPPCEPTSTS
nr:MAG TPA: hypothetical protein [Caudoviricetes sp.]